MKIYILILLELLLIVASVNVSDFLSLPKEINIVTNKKGEGVGGFWQNKLEWKAHWVKHWIVKTIYEPRWRKVWGPVEVKEWIPFPATLEHEHPVE